MNTSKDKRFSKDATINRDPLREQLIRMNKKSQRLFIVGIFLMFISPCIGPSLNCLDKVLDERATPQEVKKVKK